MERDGNMTTADRSRAQTAARPASGAFNHMDVARTLKADYVAGAKDSSTRALDSLHTLVRTMSRPDVGIDELTKQTARLIFTQFNLREVSVGLRGGDGLYRYVAQHGMRADVWAAHQRLTYTDSELFDPKKYKFTSISKYTRLFLAEDLPYDDDELATYSEHLSSTSKRRSLHDAIEGDYLDFLIMGPNDNILGWIETSGTWDGHMPDITSIRCIEIIASLLGIAITHA